MKRALVVGSAGQDGRILLAQLGAKGHASVGVDRDDVDVRDGAAVQALVQAVRPDAIYYLAAHHHSSEEATDADVPGLFRHSLEVNVTGLVNVLEGAKRAAPEGRVFYAASSHVFGRPEAAVQNERTPRNPINIYGLTKSAGIDAVRFYRAAGLHASTGILYNHESIYRTEKFVSMRLARAARDAAEARRHGKIHRVEIGSFAALVDWGYAPDYTKAMQQIVEHSSPDDYVVATGEPHTVRDFAEAAFAALDLDYRVHVSERPGIIQKPGVPLVGDATKLRAATGWAPTVTFMDMVSRIARGEL